MAPTIENLNPFQSEEEAREKGRRGGIASGESKRKRKALREELLALLQSNNAQDMMCAKLIDQAKNGSIKAFEVIRDTIGEKPVEKHQIEAPNITFTMGDDLSG